MEITRTYAGSAGQKVSSGLYSTVERGDMPLDSGYGEAEIIEIESPQANAEPVNVRVDTVPHDTIAVSPDAAASAAMAMQSLNGDGRGELGFRVEYSAD